MACRDCPDMIPPVVSGEAVSSRVFLIGQAPGPHEGRLGKPFAYTAGRTLFRWFASIGVDESEFRRKVHMAAMARCFPGKSPKGGDRVPSRVEIETCGQWMSAEADTLHPQLVIPVGALAIRHFLGPGKLVDHVGHVKTAVFFERPVDFVCLPHPSGLSTWHKTEPGRSLLEQALGTLTKHPTWQRTFEARLFPAN